MRRTHRLLQQIPAGYHAILRAALFPLAQCLYEIYKPSFTVHIVGFIQRPDEHAQPHLTMFISRFVNLPQIIYPPRRIRILSRRNTGQALRPVMLDKITGFIWIVSASPIRRHSFPHLTQICRRQTQITIFPRIRIEHAHRNRLAFYLFAHSGQ